MLASTLILPGIALASELGRGGASVVYEGHDERTGQQVAVKVVQGGPAPAQFVERALREGALCWTLNHPNVVRVFEWGRSGDAGYLVMERLVGEDLGRRLARVGRMAAASVVHIAQQVASALGAIHAQGAVHRDIKPENVFLCANGPVVDHVKVLDLGIAGWGAADGVQTMAGMVFGTPGFLAPEQARGEKVTPLADLYALGGLMFVALTGRVPHGHDADPIEMVRRAAFATVAPTLPDDVPAPLADLVRALLDPDPARRPPDTRAVLQRLRGPGAVETRVSAATTVLLQGRPTRLGDLQLPTLGDHVDHDRFRQHVVMALATVFPPGRLPTALRALLDEVDHLNDRRAGATALASDRRDGANTLARDLRRREEPLRHARADLAARIEAGRNRYLRLSGHLLRLADEIGDADHSYADDYRAVTAVQRAAAAGAAQRGGAVELRALYGEQIQGLLARLEDARAERERLVGRQQAVRDALGPARREVGDLAAQEAELARSLLALTVERESTLAPLEDAARTAEDEALGLDRAVEHIFLRLGAALHRALLERA